MSVLVPAGFSALPLSISQLSLAAVLRCGQSFRWGIFPLHPDGDAGYAELSLPTHEYRLCLRDRVVCLRQSADALFYRSVFPPSVQTSPGAESRDRETLLWLQDYFQLDVDLIKLYQEWSGRDPVFCSLKERFGGVRMLRQDPFENLVSYVSACSFNIL